MFRREKGSSPFRSIPSILMIENGNYKNHHLINSMKRPKSTTKNALQPVSLAGSGGSSESVNKQWGELQSDLGDGVEQASLLLRQWLRVVDGVCQVVLGRGGTELPCILLSCVPAAFFFLPLTSRTKDIEGKPFILRSG